MVIDNKAHAIRKEGHSKVICVTKLLPDNWKLCHAHILRRTNEAVTIKFERIE